MWARRAWVMALSMAMAARSATASTKARSAWAMRRPVDQHVVSAMVPSTRSLTRRGTMTPERMSSAFSSARWSSLSAISCHSSSVASG